MFLHYLAKQTNTKIASFHSMSYDYCIENFKNTFCMDCLLIVSFCYRNSLQQVFEMSSLHAYLQTLSPLADRWQQRQQHFAADRSKRQVAAWVRRHCGSASRTHAVAWSPKSCYQRGSGSDCWGVIALEKWNQLFHAAGVRLYHAPDVQVRCPAERRNCHPLHVR